MEDIALTNTLLDVKTPLYDDSLSLTNIINNNSNNTKSANSNSNQHIKEFIISNSQPIKNLNLILLNKNKKTNSHLKYKYNLPVEIIDYDNLNNNPNNITNTNTNSNSITNLSSTLNTSTTDIQLSETNNLSTSLSSTNTATTMNNKIQQSNRSQSIVKQQNTLTTVSEVNAKPNVNVGASTINNSNSNLNKSTQQQTSQLLPNNNSNGNNQGNNDKMLNLTSINNGDTQALPKKAAAKVTSRIVFLKLGQIDTRNERYDAEAYIECSWEDDQIFKILADPNMTKNIQMPNGLENMVKQAMITTLTSNNLVNLKNVINNINSLEYDTSVFWTPQLYIENAIGDIKEEIRHKLEIVEKEGSDLLNDPNFDSKQGQYKNIVNNLTVRVCEMRKLRGVFYERLELYDFPMDMQELSITLTSKRSVNEVVIVENEKDCCSINTEDFLDQQEWDLFGHVETSKKNIYDPWRKYNRTAFSVTCYIARKPGYYLYNAYMLIFLITVLGFVPFAFDVSGPQFRCQVTGLLLLTSVNFRWIVTQRLPSVPYLTSLDKYAIGSLFSLVLFCVWHSLIGSNVITRDQEFRQIIDNYVFIGAGIFYLFYNIGYITWFIKMARTIKKFHLNSLKQLRDVTSKKINETDEKENDNLLELSNSNNNTNNNNNTNTNNNNEKSGSNVSVSNHNNKPMSNLRRVSNTLGQSVATNARKKTLVNPENITLFA